MEAFFKRATELSNAKLAAATPELIQEFESVSGNSLPVSLREFLERAAGSSSAIYSDSVAAATFYGGVEFYELHELISMQERLVADGALARVLCQPFFVVGGVTGPGSSVVLLGSESDPKVLHIEGSNEQPVLGSGSLVGETFTGYLDSLLLSKELRSANGLRHAPLFEFDLSRPLTNENVSVALAEFDLLITRLCNHRLKADGDQCVGLRNVVGPDHKWFRVASESDQPHLSVSSNSVSTLWDGLVLACIGVGLTEVLGGEVVDSIGLLGDSVGCRYTAGEVSAELVQKYRVDGNLDALALSFRHVLEAKLLG